MDYSQWWAINQEAIGKELLSPGLSSELKAHTLFQYCFHEGRAEGYAEAKKQQERDGKEVDAEWQKIEVEDKAPELPRFRPRNIIDDNIKEEAAEYDSADVRVMLSHDYCHFEIHLEKSECTAKDIDDTRKEAARLAEKGVRQYIVAKRHIMSKVTNREQRAQLKRRVEEIEKRTPEGSEYAPEDIAAIKALKDIKYQISREYNYQDDWIEDEDEENDNIF
jgi:hypothetical protein